MFSLKSDGSVAVIIRIRPQSEKELRENCCVITEVDNDQKTIYFKNCQYSFDRIFDVSSKQREIFEDIAKPLIEKCLEGYNTAIFAYGQTGSGKTYTMGTSFDGVEIEEQTGILPRVLHFLFHEIEKQTNQLIISSTNISVQFLELYNEDVFDLLDPKHRASKLIKIHEDASGGIIINGCTSRNVHNFNDVLSILSEGSKSRITASTSMNLQSSRSHAIFSVLINQTRLSSEDKNSSIKLSSKFHLVDLAGSERLSRTGAVGDRAKEAISINSGLLALGNVINALGDKSRRGCHVPYRDSKLTRLLQDSLGGNSFTMMMACVSPSDCDFSETISTLNYALRAKNIKNKVLRNQIVDSKNSSKLSLQIKILKEQLENQANQVKVYREKCSYYEKLLGVEDTKNISIPSHSSNAISPSSKKIKDIEGEGEHYISATSVVEENSTENIHPNQEVGIICESSDIGDLVESKNEFEVPNIDLKTDIINEHLLEINSNIAAKEDIIKQLEERKLKYEEMMEQYEFLIASLTDKIDDLHQREAEELTKYQTIEKSTSEDVNVIKKTYTEKIKALQNELKEIKSRQLSYQKQVFDKEQTERELSTLKSELGELKHTKVSLVRQLRSEIVLARKRENEFMKKLNVVERNASKKDNEIHSLKMQKEKTENVLRSKIEQLEAVKRQIRPILPKPNSISNVLPKPSCNEIVDSECNKTYIIEKEDNVEKINLNTNIVDPFLSPLPNKYNPYSLIESPAITADTKNKWKLIHDQVQNFTAKKETIVILNQQIEQSIQDRKDISNKLYTLKGKLENCTKRSEKRMKDKIFTLEEKLKEIQSQIENDQKAVAEIEMNETRENAIELFKTCKKGADLYIFRHVYNLLLNSLEKVADQNIKLKEQEIHGKIKKNKRCSSKTITQPTSPISQQHQFKRRKTALPQEISQSLLADGNPTVSIDINLTDTNGINPIPSTRRVTRNMARSKADKKTSAQRTTRNSNEEMVSKENVIVVEDSLELPKQPPLHHNLKKRPLLNLEKAIDNLFDK